LLPERHEDIERRQIDAHRAVYGIDRTRDSTPRSRACRGRASSGFTGDDDVPWAARQQSGQCIHRTRRLRGWSRPNPDQEGVGGNAELQRAAALRRDREDNVRRSTPVGGSRSHARRVVGIALGGDGA
jgi:hypothetical protein